MSSTLFSVAAKPCIENQSNGKNHLFLFHKSTRSSTRVEATIAAPKRKSSSTIFPELSVQSIPHTDLHVREIVKRQTKIRFVVDDFDHHSCRKPQFHPAFLEEAYEQCKNICSEYAKTFYLGSTLVSLFFP